MSPVSYFSNSELVVLFHANIPSVTSIGFHRFSVTRNCDVLNMKYGWFLELLTHTPTGLCPVFEWHSKTKKLDMTSFWIPTVCKMNTTREKLLSPWILNKGNNWKHHSQFYLGWDSPWFKPCRLGFRPANPVTVGIWDLTIWNPEKLLKIGFQRVRVFKGYSYGPDYLKIGPFQIQTFLFGFQMVFRSLQ